MLRGNCTGSWRHHRDAGSRFKSRADAGCAEKRLSLASPQLSSPRVLAELPEMFLLWRFKEVARPWGGGGGGAGELGALGRAAERDGL